MKSVNSVKSVNKVPRAELLVVLAVEVALVAALHLSAGPTYAVPVDSIPEWLQSADPTVALVALARIAALGIGYWLLATTVLYAGAHLLGWSSVTGTLRWITLPFVRRVVHGITAVSLTSASLLGPATMAATPALAESGVVADEVDTSTSSGNASTTTLGTEAVPEVSSYAPEAAGWPTTDDDASFWRPVAVTSAPQGLSAAATSHVVVASDSLWGIAESHLRQTVGRPVTEDEVTQYWAKVVEANRATLRSGDPNLIYPDEQVALPPVYSD